MKKNEEANPSQDGGSISRRDLFVMTALATAGRSTSTPVSAAPQNLTTAGMTSPPGLNRRRRLGSLEMSTLGLGCMVGSAGNE